jgi:hypothetical protein
MSVERGDESGRVRILVGRVRDGDPASLPEGVVYAPDRSPDAPERVSREAVVVTDPAEIDDCRAAHAQEVDGLVDAALRCAAAGDRVDSEMREAVAAQAARAVPELVRLMKGGDPASATSAARLLLGLGRAEGEAYLVGALGSTSAEARRAAVGALREWDCPLDLTAPNRATRLTRLIADPDPAVARAAAELCAFRRLPGTEAALIRILESGGAYDPADAALRLAEVANSPRAVAALLAHFLPREAGGRYAQSTGFALRGALAHPDPAVAGPIRRALHRYTLEFARQRYDQTLVADLAETADADSIPVLEDIHARADDVVSRWYALRALARLAPAEAVGRIVAQVRRDGPDEMLIEMLRAHATERDAAAVIEAVLHAPRAAGRATHRGVVRLLLENLGAAGRAAVEAGADRLDADARAWAAWKLRGIRLESFLADLHAAGVVAPSPEELIDRMRAARRRDAGRGHVTAAAVDPSDPSEMTAALDAAGVFVAFDAETGVLPADHDALVRTFAAGSGGGFAPECAVQEWHQAGPDDYDAPYTVRFVCGGRLFRFGAENYGDWYDVEAVAGAVNLALATLGRAERFVAIEPNGQVAQFVFAAPDAFGPIAAKYGLTVTNDLASAMRLGQAYEAQGCDGDEDEDEENP